MDMRFGTWSVGYIEGITKGIRSINMLQVRFIGIADVRCDHAGTEPADDYAVF